MLKKLIIFHINSLHDSLGPEMYLGTLRRATPLLYLLICTDGLSGLGRYRLKRRWHLLGRLSLSFPEVIQVTKVCAYLQHAIVH